ncbi:unnamed protein product [Candida verbasci]|uniref:Kinetochore protein Nuf2 N-terminal domain-containing protein n=1 Tax=Candida verbasci TaxID=1227364 RepID=A0A9W4TZA8_9ASCO|nr:unnamed protein product [Candida verbasci]
MNKNYELFNTRRLKIKKDLFPILDVKEITECLTELDFNVTQEAIIKPTFDFVVNLFEQLLDTFMGIPIGTIRNKSKDLVKKEMHQDEREEEQNEEEEIEADTLRALNILTLHRYLYSFLQSIGIYDLTIMDITKPESIRLKRILSAFINYARFREEQSYKFEQLAKVSESLSDKIKILQFENESSIAKIEELNKNLQYDDKNQKRANLQQVQIYNKKLEIKLTELKINQEQLTKQHEDYKLEKTNLIQKIYDLDYVYQEVEDEVDNLKKYLETDLTLLNKIINDLSDEFQSLNHQFQILNSNFNNLGITIDSIQVNEISIKDLIKFSQDQLNNLTYLQNEKSNNKQQLENSKKLINQSKDLQNQILLYKNQLNKSNKKLNDVTQQLDKKVSLLKNNLNESTNYFNEILKERSNRNIDHKNQMDKISSLQNETEILKNNFELEIKDMDSKLKSLNELLNRYINELGKDL